MTNWLANHMKGGLRHATAMTASALLVAGTVTAVASPANAAVPEVGPLGLYGPAGNQSSFPTYYKDGTGLALEPCLDNANCGAFPSADLTNPDGEFFYNLVEGDAGPVQVVIGLEGAYIADGLAQEMTFNRLRFRAVANTQLKPNTLYTIVHPYGQSTVTTRADGSVPSNAGTTDTGCAEDPCNFNRAMPGPNGRYTQFLTWDTFGTTGAAAPPAGYVGDGATAHAIKGSPTGHNSVDVYEGTSTVGAPLFSTARFTVSGRVATGTTPPPPPAGDTQAPTVPGGLTATAAGTNTINLRWTASSDNVGVSGYRVVSDGNPAVTITGTTFSHTGLAAGSTHTYTVRAVDAAGNTSAAATVSARTGTTPPPPATVTLTARAPAINATNVRRDRSATATFSGNLTGWNTTNVKMTRLNAAGTAPVAVGANVGGTATFNTTTHVGTFNPTVARLNASTWYRVTVANVKAGTQTLATTTWRFKTGTL